MSDVLGETFLAERVFHPLPLGNVRPLGWLREQLSLQATGLTGHLDEFWPDVARSRWIGGDAEGWERGPYWLDGTVPLAFLLDDERLKAKVERWVEHILARQGEDGWLGPVLDATYSYPYDTWPRFIVLKALVQYHEATGDDRAVSAMRRFLRRTADILDERPLRSWARFRWADLVLSIHWLYERTGEPWLLRLAEEVKDQGFDWRTHFERFPYREKARREECDLTSHGPNNAMAIKAPSVWYRQSGEVADRAATHQMIAILDRFHGQSTGVFSADEHLAGKSPSQGTELCAVVEYMFSLETTIPIIGSVELADRLERIAYNALPATMSPDMWSHQYDQQVNQVECRVMEDPPWTSNGPEANIFGLEPNFGCCTANMHQGWPKLASHLWMRSADNGLAAIAYAPCTVRADINHVPVGIDVLTEYPFDERIQLTVRTEGPVRFPLCLRIPGWAKGATIEIDGKDREPATAGTFHRIEREWIHASTVHIHLPMPLRVERRHNNSVSLYRGPLLFGLKLDEEWRQIGGELPHGDWEIHPRSPWNYALDLDPQSPEISVRVETRCVSAPPFSPESAPVSLHVIGRRIPSWGLEHDAAAPVPPSPVVSQEPEEELELIPFGCTNLRVAEFPVLDRGTMAE